MIPFKSKGRDYSGCDCWGQLYLIYRDMLNITLETWKDIDAAKFKDIAKLIEYHKRTWIKIDNPQRYDVVIMKTQEGSVLESHIGCMIDSKSLIHTEERIGPRIVKVNDPFVRNRIVEYRRHHALVEL